ncbi:MAG: preprotein translocase subunit SecA [Candidatus Magasanikbacteria bacterium]|nr:preprotein translocase subunit SecA [Candidatus Magasanikbacteria bacterium]
MSFLTKIFGDPNAKVLSTTYPLVEKINGFEPILTALSDEAIKAKTPEFKNRLAGGATLDDILPEAFAVVREVSRRLTGMRHFDVQLIGGIALHRGHIAEMRTGEGKTLVATLPAYLNALAGYGVHVVTVNDYLAKRDAVWMGQIYNFLGLSVGIIQNLLVSYRYSAKPKELAQDLTEGSAADKERDAVGAYKVEYDYLEKCSRQDAYRADIVYGTNNEFGFDYLRDNMVQDLADMSQRGLHFAIVDEVDSILIDEARTPLIISAPAEKATDTYYKFAELVQQLAENDDYNVDEKMRSSTLTDAGLKRIEQWLGVDNIYVEGGMATVHHVEQALRARALFKRDRDYVVENGEVIIVDEFTGRKMPGRRYSEGLHQAIEAKEGVEIQRESQTMATVTFQNYFRMYSKLSGMTGTAVTEAEEFGKIYKLEVVVIPTNKTGQRVDHPDRIYRTEAAKYQAIALAVKALQAKGQPVLIGTISVEKNEQLGLYLEREGIKHEILNAKNHEREGEIIAQAGHPGAVTLATNMAGRGVDIILGGNPPVPEEAARSREAGGLFVIGTERHESRRIDNQLRGRSARQGDSGASQFYLSTEDDLMRIFAGDRIKRVMQTLRIPDDMPIEQKTISRIIESAQKKVEGFHFDTRKHLLEYDDVINRHREVIYGKRRAILESFEREKVGTVSEKPTLRQTVLEMVETEIEQIISFHTNAEDRSAWNVKEVAETVATIFPLSEIERAEINRFGERGTDKLDAVSERTRIVEYLVKLAEAKYDDLLVKKTPAPQMLLEIEKQILLRSIDTIWVEHLVAIDHLRTGIGLRGYGQRDPLVEYKKETYRMFNELLSLIQKEVVYAIYKMSLGIQLAPSVMEQNQLLYQGAPKSTNEVLAVAAPNAGVAGRTVGRNDPCPCGSGKKFKKCHGAAPE